MNLLEIFLEEVGDGTVDSSASTNSLKEYYDGATQLQQAAINETFVMLCGQSYETLLAMELDEKYNEPKSMEI